MAIITKAPRGTQDVLPEQSGKWQYIEKTALETASLYGFKEIRFPTFEHTELFARGVGDGTDVVQKEMPALAISSSSPAAVVLVPSRSSISMAVGPTMMLP